MPAHPCPFARFLSLTEGNWRNAVFIESCRENRCVHGTPCQGYLFAADDNGAPVLFPLGTLRRLTGEEIDPSECGSRMSRAVFERVYHQKLLWLTESDLDCGVCRLASEQGPLPCEGCTTRDRPSF